MPSKLFKTREKINLTIYDSKSAVLSLLKYTSIIVSITALGSIVYYYGFPKDTTSDKITSTIIYGSLIFYLLKYSIRVLYEFHPLKFIRENWFEGIVLLLFFIYLIFNAISDATIFELLTTHLDSEHLASYLLIFLQAYFLIVVLFEVGKSSVVFTGLHIGPALLLILSFIMLIAIGTGLLLLPEMTYDRIRFIDALFTSTSASCVTGLIVVDTATFFTFKGQMVIMLLIQLGGINIISFATFFVTFSRKTGGIKYQSLIKDFLSAEQLSDTRNILRQIVLYSLFFEVAGTILIMYSWGHHVMFADFKEKLFFSVFHSISAFNNAGFSLFSNNLFESGINNLFGLQLVIIILVILGGLGFINIQDMIKPRDANKRIRHPWKRLQVNTKVSISSTLFLIFFGALLYYLLEKNHFGNDASSLGLFMTSVFQSVTTRTAGFNTVDIGSLQTPVLILFIFLMFIGASPGSTGGGIKTTTFAVIVKSAMATIRRREHIEFFKHNISFSLVDKAYSIALFSISLIFFSAFLLTITEPGMQVIDLFFEEVSAFGTVGLTTGITPFLSTAGKTIIISSMFIGRIGTLTLALAISKKVFYSKYRYANANMMIG